MSCIKKNIAAEGDASSCGKLPADLIDPMFSNMPDTIIVVDLDRNILGGNWCQRKQDITIPEDVLPPCFNALMQSETSCEVCRLQQVFQSETEHHERVQDDQITFSFDVWYKPLWDSTNTVVGATIVMRDVTKLVQAEAALANATANAQQENEQLVAAIEHAQSLTMETEASHESMSHFLANMSHEIRTPMNGVLGMTELLLGTKLTTEQRDYVMTANGSAESLLAIINDILDFSKIEAGKLELEEIPFDLAGTIEEVGDLLALKAHEKGLDFVTTVAADLPPLMLGDPTRVRQTVTNLVGNAIKFTAKGDIEIHAEQLFGDKTTAEIKISIKDSGIGISQKAQDSLFEPFTQADSSTTREFGGTGLGLSICRLLSEMMGGEIGVESVSGHGSTFWFTMVLGISQDEAPPPVAQPDPKLLAARQVVLMTQSPAVSQHLTDQMVGWGAAEPQILTGPNDLAPVPGPVAKDQRDLLFVDQGVLAEAPDIWQKLAAGRELLVLEKLGQRETLPEDLADSVAGIVTKPIKPHALAAQISALLHGQQITEEAEAKVITRKWQDQDELHHLRVLVAEDNIVNQKVVQRFLKKMGLTEVTIVGNGQEALDALAAGDFDIVLMDIQMPVLDGAQAIKHIRKGQNGVRRTDIPIVALTANALVGDKEKYIKGGASDYLAKPLKAEALAETLAKWAPVSS